MLLSFGIFFFILYSIVTILCAHFHSHQFICERSVPISTPHKMNSHHRENKHTNTNTYSNNNTKGTFHEWERNTTKVMKMLVR